MEISPAKIPDVLIIKAKKHGDHRGFFSETFRADALKQAGTDVPWVQDNHSYSAQRYVVRGLHFQRPPTAQAKLLRVIKGAILDVAVDIRAKSPTYGRHVAVELSADNWLQLYVPSGFAHGFCTLTEDTEVLYKVSTPYAPAAEGGVFWNDPVLGIDWPMGEAEAVLSDRDLRWPAFANFATPF